MVKWADYVITKAKFKDDRVHILSVKVREDLGEKLEGETEWQREKVVSAIDAGKTFVTAYKKDTKWSKGEDVHVLTINNEKYIRTDKNNKEQDNLGELPEY